MKPFSALNVSEQLEAVQVSPVMLVLGLKAKIQVLGLVAQVLGLGIQVLGLESGPWLRPRLHRSWPDAIMLYTCVHYVHH